MVPEMAVEQIHLHLSLKACNQIKGFYLGMLLSIRWFNGNSGQSNFASGIVPTRFRSKAREFETNNEFKCFNGCILYVNFFGNKTNQLFIFTSSIHTPYINNAIIQNKANIINVLIIILYLQEICSNKFLLLLSSIYLFAARDIYISIDVVLNSL